MKDIYTAKCRQRHASAGAQVHSPHKATNHWTALRVNELEILQVDALRKIPWLVHGFSTRLGGESMVKGKRVLNLGFVDWDTRKSVEKNRSLLMSAAGASEMSLAPLRQFHSDMIYFYQGRSAQPPRADASIARAQGILLGVQTADCVPILLADTKRHAVAAVHAGWRGTLKRIVMKTLGRMQMKFGTRPEDTIAALGPAIGGCCYEVGPEVAQAFAGQFAMARDWFAGPFEQLAAGDTPNPLQWLTMVPPGHQPPAPRVNLDLRAANRWQLVEAGLIPENIFTSDLCTSCRSDLLFSFRKEGSASGRLMAIIGIRGKS